MLLLCLLLRLAKAQPQDPPLYPLQEGFTRDGQPHQSSSFSSTDSAQREAETSTKQAYSYGIEGMDMFDPKEGDDYYPDSTSPTTTSIHGSTSTPASTYHLKSLQITIPQLGKLQGKREDGRIDFYGNIPYAAPPVGQARFAPPEPPPPWAPVMLDATKFGPDCWQLMDPVMNPGARKEYMSEDCLTLNVFTPAGHAKKVKPVKVKQQNSEKLLPVLVWLHGGAFQQGGARRPEYDGRRLAERDVIVVTINYRLGALGFMVSSQDGMYGNFGLMDQRAALQFVHDNIVHFGGDPNRVTLFGESAGAVMTGLHLMMEGVGTLFHAAIMQSNPLGYTFRSVVVADFIGEALKRNVDCRDLECLRAERVEEIMRAQSSLMGVPRSVGDFFTWGPTLTQERNVNMGPGGASSGQTSTTDKASSASSASSFLQGQRDDFGSRSGGFASRGPFQDGLLVDYESAQHHKRRRGKGKRVRDAYAVNVTQPLKHTQLIPDNIPIIIGSNKNEGEMFVHSAFPITASKPVYWMFVGALFRDSASRILKHYRGYVEQIEAEANELAKKQVEEEENKLYYMEHQDQLEREYEILLAMNSSRGTMHSEDGIKTLIKTWSSGGGQEPSEGAEEAGSADHGGKHWYEHLPWQGAHAGTEKKKSSPKDVFDRKMQEQKEASEGDVNSLGVDQTKASMPAMHRVRYILNLVKTRVPFVGERDPEIAAEKAVEKQLKKQAKAKAKALKEAAKVVVDYRPVMSLIIDDYLFRCPSWHYAHIVSRNRVQNSDGRPEDQDSMDNSRSKKSVKKRSRNNNNLYVYRFSQPTHIPGYDECFGKSCHTAELPYVFQAMSIIRSHYSTLSPFAQREAPVAPEYPFTDILAAYQGALEEMEDDHQYGDEDLMWAQENTRDTMLLKNDGTPDSGPGGVGKSSPSQHSLLGNHTSAIRNQQQSQNNDNMPSSRTFQKLMESMFGDYFAEDADFEIAADMAERWVNFAKFGDPNYEDSKANWLPWRYQPTSIEDNEGEDENSEIPWQPQEFEYMDDEFEEEDEEDDDDPAKSGYQWSDDKAERIYRKRALKALGMVCFTVKGLFIVQT